MSTPELSEAVTATSEQAKADAENRIANANNRAASLIFGAQKLMFEEFVFASNELIERTQTEMHLFSEFVSKMAGAHSAKNINVNVRGMQQTSDRVCSQRLRSAVQAR